jgi:hypothetical protein
MTQPLFQSEQLAAEWASRICTRLQQIGVADDEVNETRNIIFAFTRIAAEELSKNRQVTLPYTDQPFMIEAKQAHQIIDLFLRGVNQVAKKLRDTGMDWDQRREHLETLAWKLFNLAKLLVGFLYIPNPDMPAGLNTEKDLQLMMKSSAEALFREQVNGIKSIPMPWNMNWKSH